MRDLAETKPDNWKTELVNYLEMGIATASPENMQYYEYASVYLQNYAPAIIYKYLPDEENRIDAIVNDKLWFSLPSTFNDVFDSDLVFDADSIVQSVISQLTSQVAYKKLITNDSKLREYIAKERNRFQSLVDDNRNTFGVSCFSESCSSLLMWAHYANNHKGLCVGYRLLDFFLSLSLPVFPVIYSNNRAKISSVDLTAPRKSAVQFLTKSLSAKSLEWSYEKEWRIICDTKALGNAWDTRKKGALLQSPKPNVIILGCNADENRAFKDNVVTCCNDKRIKLFKMEKDKNEYRLNLTPVIS